MSQPSIQPSIHPEQSGCLVSKLPCTLGARMLRWTLLAVLLLSSRMDPALAQITVTQGDATLFLQAPTDLTVGNADLRWKGVDQLYQLWFWYRVEGDAAETRFGVPDSQAVVGTTGVLEWSDVDGRGFSVYMELDAIDCKVNAAACGGAIDFGGLFAAVVVGNETAAPLDLNLFVYLDIDAGGTAANDFATGGPGPSGFSAEVRDGRDTVSLLDVPVANASPFPTLRNRLEDSVADVLMVPSTGMPLGPDDVTLAVQAVLPIATDDSALLEFRVGTHQAIFVDGFESGGVGAWSSSMP